MESELTKALIGIVSNKESISSKSIIDTLENYKPILENIDMTKINLDKIAPILHYFYCIQNIEIRTLVLHYCLIFELVSPLTISEKYKFDYLIAQSLTQKGSQFNPSQRRLNDEIQTALAYISIFLRIRRFLPSSIIRAFIAFYDSTEKPIQSSFVWTICEMTVVCDNIIIDYPKISKILSSYLLESGSEVISKLFVYLLEKNDYFVSNSDYFLSILSPLSQISSSIDSTASITSLVSILRTWPGVLNFGIKNGIFMSLIQCLPHSTDSIIEIFQQLLNLNNSTYELTDGFCGFCIYTLIKLGLIESLKTLSKQNKSASSFLSTLLPFLNYSTSEDVESLRSRLILSPDIKIPPNSKSILFDVAQSLTIPQKITTISGFTLPQNYERWDWNSILILLSVILPYNETESQSQNAKQFYQKLLQYFSGTFLTVAYGNKCTLMNDALYMLINLLSSKSWGIPIIESCDSLKQAMYNVIWSLKENLKIDTSSPQWALFRCVITMVSEASGISILKMWMFHENLINLGSLPFDNSTCTLILSSFKLYPETGLVIPIYMSFLTSENLYIHKIAINDLRQKKISTPNFHMNGFKLLLVPHIKDLYNNNNNDANIEKMKLALNLFVEIISTDENALNLITNDQTFHEILRKNSHFIYTYLLSCENGIKISNIDEEIQWWMSIGNKEYLKLYNKAVEYSFHKDFSTIIEPEIYNKNGTVSIPPHLFSQLIKTKIGIEKLTPKIPILLNELSSDLIGTKSKESIILALANFGSNSTTLNVIEENKLIEKLFDCVLKSNSASLRGFLIIAISMLEQSDYLNDVLHKFDWFEFKFGLRKCRIPTNVSTFLAKKVKTKNNFQNIDEIEGFGVVPQMLRKLTNELYMKTCIPALTELMKHNPKLFKNRKLAEYAHKLLAMYEYDSEIRGFIYSLFKTTPLLEMK